MRTTLSDVRQPKATAMPATFAVRHLLECAVAGEAPGPKIASIAAPTSVGPQPPLHGESAPPLADRSGNSSAIAAWTGRASGGFVLRGLYIMVSMATLVVGGWLTWQTLQRNEFRALVDELRSPTSRAAALPPFVLDDRPQVSPPPAPDAEPVVPAAAMIPIHSDPSPVAEQTMVPLDLESTVDTSELPQKPLPEAAPVVSSPVIVTPPSTSGPSPVVASVATEVVRIEQAAPTESVITKMPDSHVLIDEVASALPSDELATRLPDEPVVSLSAEPPLSTVDSSELLQEPLPEAAPVVSLPVIVAPPPAEPLPVVASVATEVVRIERTAPTESMITKMPDPDVSIDEVVSAVPSDEPAAHLPDEPVLSPAAGPPLDGGIFELATVDVAPRLIERVDPVVPRRHFRSKKSGRVELVLVIDRMGHVASASVHSATDEKLVAPSLRAVRLWRFSPASKRGQAVPMRVVVPLVFQSL